VTETEWNPELFKWEQIASVVLERITNGTYPAGTVLSEVALQQEFDVARGTIRLAMKALREQGAIVTKRGKGSVVRLRGDVLD